MMLSRYFACIVLLVLSGCSSTPPPNQSLTLLAANRAQLLNAQLPVESGPLSIMRASAHDNVIELMMIYNDDAADSAVLSQLMRNSVLQYCQNQQTRINLDSGIDYRIKVRNSGGQLLVDQAVTASTCQR